jgi:hypothetical protein
LGGCGILRGRDYDKLRKMANFNFRYQNGHGNIQIIQILKKQKRCSCQNKIVNHESNQTWFASLKKLANQGKQHGLAQFLGVSPQMALIMFGKSCIKPYGRGLAKLRRPSENHVDTFG